MLAANAGGESKLVYDGDVEIGTASSLDEVRALLRSRRGYTEREARTATLTRSLVTARAFHIITADTVEQMLAAIRAVRSSNPSAGIEPAADA